ncbi:MAG: tagaturonate reductase [Clostridia bacterium]|nr:tagaturonate reductase [Clostridia bacterium]
MKHINDLDIVRPARPLRVVQFGEGNFLRAFVDYMIDICNEKTDFNGSIAIVKPISYGSLERFEAQDCLYTVILRGQENGKVVNTHRIITSVDRAVDGADTWANLAELAKCPTVRFIVSNTTEAGIVLDEGDTIKGVPATYPGKLTKFLYERYLAFAGSADSGVILLPVELIENNGGRLKSCVLRLAEVWHLPAGFTAWLNENCVFCSTLVDRIVTGYPAAEAEELWETLGYRDELLDVGEPFGLWVIESDRDIRGELPFAEAGLPVVFTDNQKPYRERKVRILNGAHTSSVLAGWLYGKNIVRDMMKDPVTGVFVRKAVLDEIAPQVPLDRADADAFASAVFERFENPFIDHELLAISLNSVSKWKARVLPSLRDHYAKYGTLPRLLTFSFAALLAFYTSGDLREDGLHACRADGTPYTIRDDRAVLEFFAEKSGLPAAEFVNAVCGKEDFWGEDLRSCTGFAETVTEYLNALRADVQTAVKGICQDG